MRTTHHLPLALSWLLVLASLGCESPERGEASEVPVPPAPEVTAPAPEMGPEPAPLIEEPVVKGLRDPAPALVPSAEGLHRVAAVSEPIADSLRTLPALSDGLSADEGRALSDVASILEALTPDELALVEPALRDRAALASRAASARAADGALGDWPAEASAAPDRVGDVTAARDVTEVRWFRDESYLWVAAELAGSCDAGTRYAVELDLDRGPEPDVLVLLQSPGGAPSAKASYFGESSADDKPLPLAGMAWACEGGTLELRIPAAPLVALATKPGVRVQLSTYDALPDKATEADATPAFIAQLGDYRGASAELFALALADPRAVDQPGMTVAIAIETRFWADVVTPELLPTVVQDGIDLLDYALDLPEWVADHGIPVTFGAMGLEEKMAWACRGGKALRSGALPIIAQRELMGLDAYRFNAHTAADLVGYRAILFSEDLYRPTLDALTGAVDDWVWGSMQYSTNPASMAAQCTGSFMAPPFCKQWEVDKSTGSLMLGKVGGAPVMNHKGSSSSFQLEYFHANGQWKGDCNTHSQVTRTFYRAIGLATTEWYWFPTDPYVKQIGHAFPVYFDPARGHWRSYQRPTDFLSAEIGALSGYNLPVRDPLTWMLWHLDSTGVAVAQSEHTLYGYTFGDITALLQTGIAPSTWVDAFWTPYPDGVTEQAGVGGLAMAAPLHSDAREQADRDAQRVRDRASRLTR
jgi:hypothetical protein